MSKEGKQTKLFSKKKPKKDQKRTEGTKAETTKQDNKQRVNPFKCWLEEIKPFLKEENPELSDEEIMKLAMNQWRETPKEEKQVWEKKANGEVTVEKTKVYEGNGITEKKRKRKDGEEKEEEKSDEIMVKEKENISKKIKVYEKQKVDAKLSGFAFNKK